MKEAARTSETLVNFYQTTRRYNTEDSRLRTHRRENLKSYESSFVFTWGGTRTYSVGSGRPSFSRSVDDPWIFQPSFVCTVCVHGNLLLQLCSFTNVTRHFELQCVPIDLHNNSSQSVATAIKSCSTLSPRCWRTRVHEINNKEAWRIIRMNIIYATIWHKHTHSVTITRDLMWRKRGLGNWLIIRLF
jgi:hypothetical protein